MADRRNINEEHIPNLVEQLGPQPVVNEMGDDNELEFNQFDVAVLLGELKFN